MFHTTQEAARSWPITVPAVSTWYLSSRCSSDFKLLLLWLRELLNMDYNTGKCIKGQSKTLNNPLSINGLTAASHCASDPQQTIIVLRQAFINTTGTVPSRTLIQWITISIWKTAVLCLSNSGAKQSLSIQTKIQLWMSSKVLIGGIKIKRQVKLRVAGKQHLMSQTEKRTLTWQAV